MIVRLLWLIALAGVGCDRGSATSDDRSPPAPRPTPADAGAPDARPGITAQQSPPRGTWQHVEATGACRAKLLPIAARTNEIRGRARDTFGRGAEIELTPLGDRVSHVTNMQQPAPAKRPRTDDELVALAKAWLAKHAELFDLDEADLAAWDHAVFPPEGSEWIIEGTVDRGPKFDGALGRAGHDTLNVIFDRRGAVREVYVGPRLYPAVSLCDATLERAAIETAVAGKRLTYDWSSGDVTDLAANPDKIHDIVRTVIQLQESPLELAVAYAVVVGGGPTTGPAREDHLTWTVDIDPATKTVLATYSNFID